LQGPIEFVATVLKRRLHRLFRGCKVGSGRGVSQLLGSVKLLKPQFQILELGLYARKNLLGFTLQALIIPARQVDLLFNNVRKLRDQRFFPFL